MFQRSKSLQHFYFCHSRRPLPSNLQNFFFPSVQGNLYSYGVFQSVPQMPFDVIALTSVLRQCQVFLALPSNGNNNIITNIYLFSKQTLFFIYILLITLLLCIVDIICEHLLSYYTFQSSSFTVLLLVNNFNNLQPISLLTFFQTFSFARKQNRYNFSSL